MGNCMGNYLILQAEHFSEPHDSMCVIDNMKTSALPVDSPYEGTVRRTFDVSMLSVWKTVEQTID